MSETKKDEFKNSGIFFPTREKVTEKSPDFTGTYNDENGNKLIVAVWKKQSKNGGSFYTFSISKPK